MNYLESALCILNKIESVGFQAYIVGGFVRDYLLNIESNDIDITTNARISDLLNLFENVILSGDNFEGVTINLNGYSFEVTTFRKDLSYNSHRHPIVEVANNLDEDLIRRDFTINAMCFDSNLNLIDKFDAKKDLDNKIIRSIGDPYIRFDEDALRILRALYFSSKLNFDIEPQTLLAINYCAKYIDFLSGERVKEELTKLFNSKYQSKGIGYIINSNVILFLPSLNKALNLIYKSHISVSLIEALSLGFYLEGKSDRYNLTKKEKKEIDLVISLIDKEFDTLTIFNNDINILNSANKLKEILNLKSYSNVLDIKNNFIIKSKKELDISANDLKENNVLDKDISKVLNKLLGLVLDKKIENKKEILISYIKDYN